MVKDVQITFDCADPAALAAFWAEVLGYELQPPPGNFETWDAALDAWGVPPEERNSRSALIDPDGARPRVAQRRHARAATGGPRHPAPCPGGRRHPPAAGGRRHDHPLITQSCVTQLSVAHVTLEP